MMLVTHLPYNIDELRSNRDGLNSYSLNQAKKAFEDQEILLESLIDEVCDLKFLQEELINFVDQIIDDKFQIDANQLGDAINASINTLFEKPGLNHLKPCEKDFKKAMVMKALNDVTRYNNLLQTRSIKAKTIKTQNTTWKVYADSFVGSHTKSVNSDSYSVGGRSLACIADGVSCANKEKDGKVHEFYMGHKLAKILTERIQNYNFHSDSSNFDQSTADDQSNTETEFYLNNILTLCTDIAESEFKPNLNSGTNFFDQLEKFFKENSNNKTLTKVNFKNKNLRLTLTALMPLSNLRGKLQNTFVEMAKNQKLKFKEDGNVNASSTLVYALKLGDKIVTVKASDSEIECYDKEGHKLKPENTYIQKDGDYNVIESEFNKESAEVTMRFPGHFEDASHNNMTVSIYNKNDVDQIVLASDGIMGANHPELPKELKTNAKDNFLDLISIVPTTINKKPNYDDKTVVVLKKQ